MLRRGLKLSAAHVPVVACSALMSALYVAGFLSLLRPAAVLLFWGGIAGLLWCAARDVQARKAPQELESPALCAFAALGLLGCLLLRHATFSRWDDFTNWGPQARDLASTHAFAAASSTIRIKDYPPMTALFQYLAFSWGGYRESTTIFGQALLLLAALATTMSGCAWGQRWKAPAGLGFLLLMPHLLGRGFATTYVDATMGAFFGAAVLVYWTSRERARPPYEAVVVLFALAVLKPIGVCFALAAAALMTLDSFKRARGRLSRPARMFCLLALLAPICSAGAWEARLRALSIPKQHATDVDRPEPTRREIARAYRRAIAQRPLHERARGWEPFAPLTAPAWLLLLLGLPGLAAWLWLPARGEAQWKLLTAWFAAFYSAYVLAIGWFFVWMVPVEQALPIWSFDRYASSPLLGFSMIVFGVLLADDEHVRPGRELARRAALLGTLAALALLQPPLLAAYYTNPPLDQLRASMEYELDYLRGLVSERESIYVVSDGPGFVGAVLRYELWPREVNAFGWNDGLRAHMSPQQWRRQLRGYDFLYVKDAGRLFWSSFAPRELEPDTAGRLYRVSALSSYNTRP